MNEFREGDRVWRVEHRQITTSSLTSYHTPCIVVSSYSGRDTMVVKLEDDSRWKCHFEVVKSKFEHIKVNNDLEEEWI